MNIKRKTPKHLIYVSADQNTITVVNGTAHFVADNEQKCEACFFRTYKMDFCNKVPCSAEDRIDKREGYFK